MLSKETFQEQLAMLAINYGFDIRGEDGQIYKRMVYEALKDLVTDSAFISTSQHILKEVKLTEWNEAYGFKGKPAVADWVAAYVPKPIYVEKTFYKICPITGANLAERRMVLVENLKEIGDER